MLKKVSYENDNVKVETDHIGLTSWPEKEQHDRYVCVSYVVYYTYNCYDKYYLFLKYEHLWE